MEDKSYILTGPVIPVLLGLVNLMLNILIKYCLATAHQFNMVLCNKHSAGIPFPEVNTWNSNF